MSLSVKRERTGVTDIGLKSDSVSGVDTFNTGVTMAVNHVEGTTPERME
jgi:hypothetical protein